MDKLLLNHTYLLKYYYSNTLSSVTVLNITNTSYQLRWNQSNIITWEEKKIIHHIYSVVEDISDFVQDVDVEKYCINTKWVQCTYCNGSGSVPNSESTAGFVTCPVCFGAKQVFNVGEIS